AACRAAASGRPDRAPQAASAADRPVNSALSRPWEDSGSNDSAASPAAAQSGPANGSSHALLAATRAVPGFASARSSSAEIPSGRPAHEADPAKEPGWSTIRPTNRLPESLPREYHQPSATAAMTVRRSAAGER